MQNTKDLGLGFDSNNDEMSVDDDDNDINIGNKKYKTRKISKRSKSNLCLKTPANNSVIGPGAPPPSPTRRSKRKCVIDARKRTEEKEQQRNKKIKEKEQKARDKKRKGKNTNKN